MRTLALLGVLAAFPALADTAPVTAPAVLHRTRAAITIDGELSDAGWQGATTFDQFFETNPGDNIPAGVKTVAMVTYDDRFLYIGVRCDDPHPEDIRAPYVDRDGVIGTDDNVAVFLDTRNDKHTAIELRVNPRGIQGDGFFNDANGNEDFSPDYFYDTAAKITATGWNAEFRIPFSSLRYPHSDPQTWNILFWRNYPRQFRYAFHSAPLPRGSNCLVCYTHALTGLTNLPESGHLVAAPYVSSQRIDRPEGAPGTRLGGGSFDTNAGADIKYNPTATSAIDLTINPDFSQIEADVPQITVNQRFALFFPEKRPFFLEGFDLFDTPMQVAYTRTITSPRAGVRTTGKFGNTAYTLLIADDRGGGTTILPGPLFSDGTDQGRSMATIGRLRHELGTSFVGALLTDRENHGGGHNRVMGPDFLWRPNEATSINGQLLFSDTSLGLLAPGLRQRSGHAAYLAYNHQNRKYDAFAEGRDISDGFRADLGFIPQVGFREYDGAVGRHWWPEKSRLRHIRLSMFADYQNDAEGRSIFQQNSVAVNAQGVKNLAMGIAVRPAEQVLVRDFATKGERDVELRQSYSQFSFQIDPSRRITRVGFRGRFGQSIDYANVRVGHGTSLSVFATLRPVDRLTLDGTASRELINAQGGRVFLAQVERLKATYSFSNKSLVRAIGQYVATQRDPARYNFPVRAHSGGFSGSLLYSYKLNWQTVLFAGYGDERTLTERNDLLRQDRSLFFKVSYAYQR